MKTSKRFGTIALAVIIGFGLISLPDRNVSYAMSAADFTDVASSYWGYKYIDFSASNGIINGYKSWDGSYQFLPEKAVTREESTTMLYRALSAAGKLRSNEDFSAKYADLLTDNKIADWAKKYVAYGLEYELISENELADFTDSNGFGLPAPREQIAVWTAKAMGRKLSPAYSLIYVDKDNISEKTLPYIDLLYRYGIMQGDDMKMFHPTNGIKRAEFAAISNRVFESSKTETYSEDKEIQSYRGTIVSVDSYNNRIMMTQSDGSGRVIQINPKTQIVINGKVNYNGIIGVDTNSTAVVAWGAFYDESRPSNDDFQLHIITKTQTRTGLLTGIEKMDGSTTILEIENQDGDTIYYVLDKDSRTDGTPKKETEVTFIADGIKILEMK